MQTFDEIKQNIQPITNLSSLSASTCEYNENVKNCASCYNISAMKTEDVRWGEMCISMRSEEIVGLEWREISLYSVIWSEDGDLLHYCWKLPWNISIVRSYDWHFRASRSRVWKIMKTVQNIGHWDNFHSASATGNWCLLDRGGGTG